MHRIFDDRTNDVKSKIAIVFGLLIVANIAAWTWAWTAFADKPALLGIAFVAYMLGIRHAFDADHIAAIDNVVRKLMQEGKQPFSAGLFFSLGHSSVVVLTCLAVAATATAMQGELDEFGNVGGVIGTSIGALFLLALGLANLIILKNIWAAFSRARRGERVVDEALDALLAGRGLLVRFFRRTFRIVSRSWHMYPVGFLFGLGFDTATEIGLLGISAAQASQGAAFSTTLIFPALFTAGMSLMDTADSALMSGAYGWALINPVRKLWYNLTITAASVIVAIFMGGLEGLALVSEKLNLQREAWQAIATFNDSLGNLGFAVVCIFIASWIVSTVIYRAKGYDLIALNPS
ncbi:high-affinity nickel-transport protein [Sinorhizobium terangae]|uniref:Nickel/cobalt efflux system n=1 Tax=Sinorhizobium terangae TaxID=110322 RepID=A0A6N7LKC7_SINTE|nr:HoxN/HupN/NixA family nickel/cobalt transporter [Sinorhizobium terangae]MBB4188448.1 high-affinity nickel-transport protein [Sinorhizobium terangae]MQX18086.1 HoxN/HupN/NixA family nickel/cobalt transporter [Sinorhizobium terangae]